MSVECVALLALPAAMSASSSSPSSTIAGPAPAAITPPARLSSYTYVSAQGPNRKVGDRHQSTHGQNAFYVANRTASCALPRAEEGPPDPKPGVPRVGRGSGGRGSPSRLEFLKETLFHQTNSGYTWLWVWSYLLGRAHEAVWSAT
eukprot:3790410-Pyramimonas_sp.AAC.1